MYPVFLISLTKDAGRREALKRRFKSYDDFRLIDAVDGRQMNAREYFGYVLPSFRAYGKILSPAEVGCSLSHVKAYEAFLASEAKFALVLEDDVIGDDVGVAAAFELAEQIPQNSLLVCGCQDGLAGRFSAFGKRVNLNANLENTKLWLVSKYSHSSIYRAGAYVLTRQSAQNLLRIHKRALCTTDVWEYLLKQDDMAMYFSDIFSHPIDLSGSNIEAERIDRGYKPNLKARLKSLKFLFCSRFEKYFMGHERIFKRDEV
ncbi:MULTISPECIES: glycosyltransferase family 25 protein [Campylobacter]|uniref:glycosyltransferase family 25 protein n=1 Tax=Campylobacter TaxID=194 RepID=UPI00027A3709|nr:MULTISPECIES: glycosyltransferase family 25 protein [Campylobacter]EJP74638.1 LPS glycosyltransferase [Campylobacter sp. FOBRC14]